MRKQGRVLVDAIALFVVVWGVGCGGSSQTGAVGGDASQPGPDAIAGGRRSFDVVAGLRGTGPISPRRPTDSFTLVVDFDARLVIVGGNGRGAVVGVTTSDGRTFHSLGGFTIGASSNPACIVPEEVIYDSFEITVAEGSLSGSASGTATISSGDSGLQVPFTATLTGTADVTRPALLGVGVSLASPFASMRFVTSEPLPASASARLVGSDGAAIDLIPTTGGGDVPIVVGFSKPEVVLRAGSSYAVELDGLVDFAGLKDEGGTVLRLGAFGAAPVVLEDGFESVTGSVFGGARVMTAGSLPAIAGNTSLYVGNIEALLIDSVPAALMVRLLRQSGDSKLRFSYRVVASVPLPSFAGELRVGSAGASPGPGTYTFNAPGPVEELTIAGMPMFASSVASMEVALPADATDEVLVTLVPGFFTCMPIPSGAGAGLLIDDLRLE